MYINHDKLIIRQNQAILFAYIRFLSYNGYRVDFLRFYGWQIKSYRRLAWRSQSGSHQGEGEDRSHSLAVSGTPLWTRPLASNLDDYDGIVEIRIRYMNIQYLLMGFMGPYIRQFTWLFPAFEQGNKFIPRN